MDFIDDACGNLRSNENGIWSDSRKMTSPLGLGLYGSRYPPVPHHEQDGGYRHCARRGEKHPQIIDTPVLCGFGGIIAPLLTATVTPL